MSQKVDLPALIEDATNKHQAGQLADAEVIYRKVLEVDPNNFDANHLLGLIHHQTGNGDKAIKRITHSLQHNPDSTEAHYNLAEVLREVGRRDEAVGSFQKAIAANPNFVQSHNNLGSVYLELGRLDEALESYRNAMAISPEHSRISNNYLHALLYDPGLSNEELFEAYRTVIQDRHSQNQASVISVNTPSLGEGEKLRIGYLSSDFYDHPVGRNMLPLLGNHDHGGFEIFCYAHETREDDITGRFKGCADHWCPITGLGDEDIAAQIRDDGIHILVFLGGHFDKNRPSVAILRPAPVQVSLFGGTTTALDEMDYWLTDPVIQAPNDSGRGERFTEELVPISSFFVYPLPENMPAVAPLPADDNGFVTFASFNKPCKMNDKVLDLWSEVLSAVPDSKLMLKYRDYFGNDTLRHRLLGRFNDNGILEDRIILLSADDDFQDHMACYGQADIALDTFPFAGATTTFQALWMGVPVISLMTDRFVGRMGGGISSHAGLSELAAETPQAFVDQAAALAGDLSRLRELRKTLRQRVTQSDLCDGPALAARMEVTFRAMWKAHEAKATGPS